MVELSGVRGRDPSMLLRVTVRDSNCERGGTARTVRIGDRSGAIARGREREDLRGKSRRPKGPSTALRVRNDAVYACILISC